MREPDFPAGMTITPEIFKAYFYDYSQDNTPGHPPIPEMEPFILTCNYYKFTGKDGKKGISKREE